MEEVETGFKRSMNSIQLDMSGNRKGVEWNDMSEILREKTYAYLKHLQEKKDDLEGINTEGGVGGNVFNDFEKLQETGQMLKVLVFNEKDGTASKVKISVKDKIAQGHNPEIFITGVALEDMKKFFKDEQISN